MITQRVPLSAVLWTEITQGSTVLLVEGGASGSFFIHFSNTDSQPDIDAPSHQIQTYRSAIDFSQMGLVTGQRLWAKAQEGESSFLIVTREVDVFNLFVPSGSDSLATSNGFTFKVKEAA